MDLYSRRLSVNLFTQSFRIVIKWFFVLKRGPLINMAVCMYISSRLLRQMHHTVVSLSYTVIIYIEEEGERGPLINMEV